MTYANSETYFHSQKPKPFDDAVWRRKRVGVMKTGLKSHPHPLLVIKADEFWGFDPRFGGENMLAKLLMELCAELLT